MATTTSVVPTIRPKNCHCFLCAEQIHVSNCDDPTNVQTQNQISIDLFRILGVDRKRLESLQMTRAETATGFKFCSTCLDQIAKCRLAMEQLEKLAKDVAGQKYLIQFKLFNAVSSENQDELATFRNEIVTEDLNSDPIFTLLETIRKKQFDRIPIPSKPMRGTFQVLQESSSDSTITSPSRQTATTADASLQISSVHKESKKLKKCPSNQTISHLSLPSQLSPEFVREVRVFKNVSIPTDPRIENKLMFENVKKRRRDGDKNSVPATSNFLNISIPTLRTIRDPRLKITSIPVGVKKRQLHNNSVPKTPTSENKSLQSGLNFARKNSTTSDDELLDLDTDENKSTGVIPISPASSNQTQSSAQLALTLNKSSTSIVKRGRGRPPNKSENPKAPKKVPAAQKRQLQSVQSQVKNRIRAKCDECGKDFSSEVGLYIHKREFHRKVFRLTCRKCNFRCNLNSRLKDHDTTVHTKVRNYKCAICPAAFMTRTVLKSHMKTHTQEKPYVCNFCHKRFARNQGLTDHMRTHTHEKPYACQLCSRRFATRPTLIKHMRGPHGVL